MRKLIHMIFLWSVFVTVVWAQPQTMSAERLDDRWIIRINDQTFTVYRFGNGQKYPYFYPVNGPLSGLSVTTESSLPYPHHRSLFFGCDRVNGGNYWQEGNELGQIVSRGAVVLKNGPEKIVLQDTCDWRQPGQAAIITDQRIFEIFAPSAEVRIIDAVITLTALTDIHIEKTNHSLFSARMAPELSVKSNGVLVNSHGNIAEKGTYGTASPWCDYSGQRFGFNEGLAIFDSPKNPWYPCQWFTRDYGFFSPTPMYWLPEQGFSMASGKTLVLRYRVLVHGGTAEQAGIALQFERWINGPGCGG
jgi:hypothetical protein